MTRVVDWLTESPRRVVTVAVVAGCVALWGVVQVAAVLRPDHPTPPRRTVEYTPPTPTAPDTTSPTPETPRDDGDVVAATRYLRAFFDNHGTTDQWRARINRYSTTDLADQNRAVDRRIIEDDTLTRVTPEGQNSTGTYSEMTARMVGAVPMTLHVAAVYDDDTHRWLVAEVAPVTVQ